MKVRFKLMNGDEYFFKNVQELRNYIYVNTPYYYESLVDGIEEAYHSKIKTLWMSNVKVLSN